MADVTYTDRNDQDFTFEGAESFDVTDGNLILVFNASRELRAAVHPQAWQQVRLATPKPTTVGPFATNE